MASVSARQANKVFTLQDCLRLAESAPSVVSVAEQERAIADRDLSRARAAFMPRAEMLNGVIYNSPSLNDRSNFSFLPANGVREYTTYGAITQEFDTSGRLRAELQRARAGQDAAHVGLEIARRDLRRAVTIAFFRLLPTRHLVTVVGEALKESQRFESRAKLLFVGEVIEGKAQIIQGLSGGETVIVEGGYGITDGVEAHQAKGEKE
jgi:outer membrane protein TolC